MFCTLPHAQVGDVITSVGPDAVTSCAAVEGRILQLRSEYLAGVGDPCSIAFDDWEPLSYYTENDLETLREFDLEECSGTILHPAMLLATAASLISYLL